MYKDNKKIDLTPLELKIINMYEYHVYTSNFNNKISQIISILQEKYPLLSEIEIMEILNNEDNSSSNILKKYGIDINNMSIVIQNDKSYNYFLILNLAFIVITISLLLIVFLLYNKKKEKDINDITKYIEQINKKNTRFSYKKCSNIM